MRLPAVVVVLLLMALAALPASPPDEVRALVKQLGSNEFAEREAASKRLDGLGGAALAELRAALRSENPEVVHRARELVRRIEHRIDNERTLAPTLVSLDAKEERLDEVLAGLSKQANCEVVLNGTQLRTLADRRVTVSTGGKVPFWDAVLRVCAVADLQVAGAGGFSAPDALPLPTSSSPSRIRSATNANRAVVLEDRGNSPRRPAAIYGGVLVEVLPFPKTTTSTANSVLLQLWLEPRLVWGTTSGVRVGTILNDAGERLASESISLAPVKIPSRNREELVIIRQRDGGVSFREGKAHSGFQPNVRQAVVRLKPGQEPSAALNELGVAFLGTVRSGVEPLSCAEDLEANQPKTSRGVAGVEFSITYHKGPDGRLSARAMITYDRATVEPIGVGEDLPGTKGGGPGRGNHSVHGVRITDADGKPYSLGVVGGSSRPDRGRQVMMLSLELHPDRDGHGPPAAATFWGRYAKPVEVPVVLKNVPLAGEK